MQEQFGTQADNSYKSAIKISEHTFLSPSTELTRIYNIDFTE